ncbi:hypothetical protein KAFR_0A00680 [Kazachstania africana CBS 2517]|uniref:Uncharacterized protein n=1 Tax=Kazachstania africana (strain ATCC 22294 / BCRC 22015 / CBS 2517 / CECT 1963 / NBRC 1671 / NRRL Y-8276) TaxID=1071382 RepID=H2AMA6_KAZAF|nr:hypothetical protein KAFR_0A00680 [Kazachstania africana CBS 2517]CCF55506.1 hypothetical protein KAFR_0A00680 [Kazachstania africana CBS 2517]
MNVVRFLQLPVDIRRHIYYHVDGSFTSLSPSSLESLYKLNTIDLPPLKRNKASKHDKLLLKRLYPIFAEYIEMFEYDPEMIRLWLEYSLWLRYDAIVLDNLRVNHAYEGSLLGPLDWIYLNDKLRLGYFDSRDLFQVWYTLKEYNMWVVEGDTVGEYNTDIYYYKLSLDHVDKNNLGHLLEVFQKKKLLNSIHEILLSQDQSDSKESSIDVASSPSLSRASSFSNIDSFNVSSTTLTKKSVKESKITLSDKTIMQAVQSLSSMKSLRKLYSRGGYLFETFINGHGLRERPGKSINYLVKRRIRELELLQIRDVTSYGIADFTKWDNLRKLSLINIDFIDLTKLVLPQKCVTLVIRNAEEIKWWDIVERIESNIKNLEYITTCSNYQDQCIPFANCKHVKIERLNKDKLSEDLTIYCLVETWKSLQSLNFLQLQNVSRFTTDKICIAETLYNDDRIKLFQCNDLEKITLI